MANLAGAKTITQLSTEVSELLFANVAASSTTYPTSTRITQLINDKYREVCSKKQWWFLFTSSTFATVASTYNYALDDTAEKIMTMTIPAKYLKLQFLPRASFNTSYPGGNTSVTNAMPLSYIPAAPATNNALSYDLFPTPDAVYTMSYWFKKRIADLSGTQVPVIPPEWQDILVHGAAYEAFAMLGPNDPRLAYHQNIFHERLRQMWLADETNLDWMNTFRDITQEQGLSNYPGLVRPYLD